MTNAQDLLKSNIMQILTIINLPWEPENNIITRSETSHKKNKQHNSDYKSKKHCKERHIKHILTQAT